MGNINNLPPLTLKQIDPNADIVTCLENCQWNFNQILLYGGGPEGGPGNPGKRGIPGATGKGKKGDSGEKGSEIFYTDDTIQDSDPVPVGRPYQERDIVIDGASVYFKIASLSGVLSYIRQFSLSDESILGRIHWNTMAEYGRDVEAYHLIFDGEPPDQILTSAKKGTIDGYDYSLHRKILFGLDVSSACVSTLEICNIPDSSASYLTEFNQITLRYRQNSSTKDSNLSSLKGFVKYIISEDGYTADLSILSNDQAGILLRHQAVTSASKVLIQGETARFTGNSANFAETNYLDVIVNTAGATIKSKGDLTLTSDNRAAIYLNYLYINTSASTTNYTSFNHSFYAGEDGTSGFFGFYSELIGIYSDAITINSLSGSGISVNLSDDVVISKVDGDINIFEVLGDNGTHVIEGYLLDVTADVMIRNNIRLDSTMVVLTGPTLDLPAVKKSIIYLYSETYQLNEILTDSTVYGSVITVVAVTDMTMTVGGNIITKDLQNVSLLQGESITLLVEDDDYVYEIYRNVNSVMSCSPTLSGITTDVTLDIFGFTSTSNLVVYVNNGDEHAIDDIASVCNNQVITIVAVDQTVIRNNEHIILNGSADITLSINDSLTLQTQETDGVYTFKEIGRNMLPCEIGGDGVAGTLVQKGGTNYYTYTLRRGNTCIAFDNQDVDTKILNQIIPYDGIRDGQEIVIHLRSVAIGAQLQMSSGGASANITMSNFVGYDINTEEFVKISDTVWANSSTTHPLIFRLMWSADRDAWIETSRSYEGLYNSFYDPS